MITLTKRFLRAYPDAYVDNDFVVVSTRIKAVYNGQQRMMIRWSRGFNDPVNDPEELIRYTVHPCDVHTSMAGDSWVSHDRTPTFTKVVSVTQFNQLMSECQQNGYTFLKCDASSDRRMVNLTPTTPAATQRTQDTQNMLNALCVQRSSTNGFG